MSKRSKFLIHWTGKDIDTDQNISSSQVRDRYIERLRDTLLTGLWMTVPKENIIGENGSKIEYGNYMTCFTEIKLSQTSEHSSRYGHLGFGFLRKFVLDRWGAPVQYFRNSGNEKLLNCQITLQKIVKYFQENINSDKWQELFSSIYIDNYSHQTPVSQHLGLLESQLTFAISFIKNMSNSNEDDFTYLDEHEWRIAFHPQLLNENLIKIFGNPKDNCVINKKFVPGFYKIPFTSELQFIVFPDKDCKEMAICDNEIQNMLCLANSKPILLTLDDCLSF